MNRALGRSVRGRPAVILSISILGGALVTAPEAFGWGRRAFEGGAFGGGGFGRGGFGNEAGPGFGGSEGPSNGAPSQTYIYPNEGQSPQQEQTDRGQSYTWATQQSGFDSAYE